MAPQHFYRATQEKEEKVGDFIHCLERLFTRAYGHYSISDESRSALLYRQLQEGLKHRSGRFKLSLVLWITQPCLLSQGQEEGRLSELKKICQYQVESTSGLTQGPQTDQTTTSPRWTTDSLSKDRGGEKKNQTLRCWNCNKVGHVSVDCKESKKKDRNKPVGGRHNTSKHRA